jgi:hypothetical protein
MKRLDVPQGTQFGRLTVLEEVMKGIGTRRFRCQCVCGRETVAGLNSLRVGKTSSCGCYRSERTSARARAQNATHGHSRGKRVSREYQAWLSMRQRCNSPSYHNYHRYGGRGIRVDPRWNSFEQFLLDVGPWPGKGYTLDRRDNEGHYEPGNVRWATKTEQARNTSWNRQLTWQGRTQCLTEWAEELGIKRNTLTERLRNGWSVEETLTTPLGRRRPVPLDVLPDSHPESL